MGRSLAADGPLGRRRPAQRGLRRALRVGRPGHRIGLALRYDGGPCFRSHQAEIDFLGIARSPAFHYEPETNGCVEKFIQTLKEQVLWIERFETLDELRARIRHFARDFNERWLLERHGFRTPAQARETLRHAAVA